MIAVNIPEDKMPLPAEGTLANHNPGEKHLVTSAQCDVTTNAEMIFRGQQSLEWGRGVNVKLSISK